MIEAVNTAISSASVVKAVAEQVSSSRSYAANPQAIQTAALGGKFLSPHVQFQEITRRPIFIVRDADTGETLRQFPSEAQIRAYNKAAEIRSDLHTAVANFAPRGRSPEAAEALVESSVEFKEARKAVKAETPVAVGPKQSAAPLPSFGGSSSFVDDASFVPVSTNSTFTTEA